MFVPLCVSSKSESQCWLKSLIWSPKRKKEPNKKCVCGDCRWNSGGYRYNRHVTRVEFLERTRERCQECCVQSHIFDFHWLLKYGLLKLKLVLIHVLLGICLILHFWEKWNAVTHTHCLAFSASFKCYPGLIKKPLFFFLIELWGSCCWTQLIRLAADI